MRYSKIDKIRMKQINKNIVLHAIRKAEKISRKDLAANVGLTAGTITNLVNECIESKLVFESGSGASAGGRKPIYIELNPNSGYVFGIELNVNRIECILVNFKAEVIDSITELTRIEKGPEYTVEQIANIIDKLIQKNGIKQEKIIGLGLVSSGPFDREKGVMINPPNFTGWGVIHIKEMIESKTGIITIFEKDTSGAALGEYWFGGLNHSRKLFFLCVNHTGIGGGMVIDGDIFHGNNDNAADIGHIIVDINGTKCTCGKSGCLEAIVSGKTVIENYNRGIDNKDRLNTYLYYDLLKIIEKAENGDKIGIEVIEKCAYYLNIALITIIQMFSPDAILLGGEFFDNSKLLFDKTLQNVRTLTYPPFVSEISILRSSFKEKSGAMGGVAIVFKSLQNV